MSRFSAGCARMGRISAPMTFSVGAPDDGAVTPVAGAPPAATGWAAAAASPVTSRRSGSVLATAYAFASGSKYANVSDVSIVVPGRSGSSRYSTVLLPAITSPGSTVRAFFGG